MASKTFLLLALVFAVVLFVTSEVAARDLASNQDGEVDGRGGYNGGHVGYKNGGKGHGGYNKGGGHGGYNGGGHGGHGKGGGGRGRYGCKYGCCGGGGRYYNRGCKCCSSLEEATAYKQTQN